MANQGVAGLQQRGRRPSEVTPRRPYKHHGCQTLDGYRTGMEGKWVYFVCMRICCGRLKSLTAHTYTPIHNNTQHTNKQTRRVGFRAEPIPEGFCWVSGDNPLFSEDSQLWGPLPLGLIEGKVPYIIWPLNRMGPVSSQQRSPVSSSSSSQQQVTVRKGVVMIQKEEEKVD